MSRGTERVSSERPCGLCDPVSRGALCRVSATALPKGCFTSWGAAPALCRHTSSSGAGRGPGCYRAPFAAARLLSAPRGAPRQAAETSPELLAPGLGTAAFGLAKFRAGPIHTGLRLPGSRAKSSRATPKCRVAGGWGLTTSPSSLPLTAPSPSRSRLPKPPTCFSDWNDIEASLSCV